MEDENLKLMLEEIKVANQIGYKIKNTTLIGYIYKTGGFAMDLLERINQMTEDVDKTEKELLQLKIIDLCGVDILQPDGRYKNMYDVLDEIALQWDDFDGCQKDRLARLIFGSLHEKYMYDYMERK